MQAEALDGEALQEDPETIMMVGKGMVEDLTFNI